MSMSWLPSLQYCCRREEQYSNNVNDNKVVHEGSLKLFYNSFDYFWHLILHWPDQSRVVAVVCLTIINMWKWVSIIKPFLTTINVMKRLWLAQPDVFLQLPYPALALSSPLQPLYNDRFYAGYQTICIITVHKLLTQCSKILINSTIQDLTTDLLKDLTSASFSCLVMAMQSLV